MQTSVPQAEAARTVAREAPTPFQTPPPVHDSTPRQLSPGELLAPDFQPQYPFLQPQSNHDEVDHTPATLPDPPLAQAGHDELPQASGCPSPSHGIEPPSSPAAGVPFPVTRPRRATRPSSKLDPAVWDLSGLSQSPASITMEMCIEMIRWIADNADMTTQSPLAKKTSMGEGDKGY